MTYTLSVLIGLAAAAVIDLRLLRTALLRRKAFWTAYAIVLFFQLVVNGLLAGLPIVRYDPDVIIGWRVAHAPVEDLLFGFAMVLVTLSVWVRLGRGSARTAHRATRARRPSRGAPSGR